MARTGGGGGAFASGELATTGGVGEGGTLVVTTPVVSLSKTSSRPAAGKCSAASKPAPLPVTPARAMENPRPIEMGETTTLPAPSLAARCHRSTPNWSSPATVDPVAARGAGANAIY